VRWRADECVAAPLVARLRKAGYDVTYMAEIAPAATDPEAIARAHHEGRLLLTEDKDFGELVFRWNWPVPWRRPAAHRSRKELAQMGAAESCHRNVRRTYLRPLHCGGGNSIPLSAIEWSAQRDIARKDGTPAARPLNQTCRPDAFA
jgi:uncharacterized protein DUF5615